LSFRERIKGLPADHFRFKSCRKRPLSGEFESKMIGGETLSINHMIPGAWGFSRHSWPFRFWTDLDQGVGKLIAQYPGIVRL
jgi:hypothetical protein